MKVEITKKAQGFYYLDVTLDDHSILCSLDLSVLPLPQLRELKRCKVGAQRQERVLSIEPGLLPKLDLDFVEEVFNLFIAKAREGRF